MPLPHTQLEPFDYERMARSLLSRCESNGSVEQEALRKSVIRALDRPIPIDIRSHSLSTTTTTVITTTASIIIPPHPHYYKCIAL